MQARPAKTTTLALGLVLALTAGGALAAATAEAVIAKRQAGFKEMGKAFKGASDELKLDDPDVKLIAASARTIRANALAIPTWFPHGSGPEAGLKTRAKPDIWADNARFMTAAKALQAEAATFQAVAAKGEVEAIKAQFRAVGGACGGCHKPFRAED